jgi:hypothetical protein
LAVRTSQGRTKRFWYSVPTVIDSSAGTAMQQVGSQRDMVTRCPPPSLRDTTSTKPGETQQQARSTGRATRSLTSPPPMPDSQIAVSTGCRPTISADTPEPMPALTAAQTPPRYPRASARR